MWIPYHERLVGNKLVDDRARQAALEGSIFDKSLSSSDFQSLARLALMASGKMGLCGYWEVRPALKAKRRTEAFFALY
jgi:hypothetical protein